MEVGMRKAMVCVLSLAMGCGDACMTSTVSMETLSSGPPQFDWPSGPLMWLNVGAQEQGEPIGTGEPLWSIECPQWLADPQEADCISSPLVYGQVPPDAEQTVEPAELEEGVEYYVTGLLSCSGNGEGVYAEGTFTP
jgi:hypothetical protein